MKRLRLTPVAHMDISDIWDYTFNTWRPTQTRKCVREINRVMECVIQEKITGLRRNNLNETYLLTRSGRHVVFYSKTPTTIDVIRIPLERIDPSQRLTSPLFLDE